MPHWGVNSKKGCFGRKTKFFQESKDFSGKREAWDIFRETQSNKVKISGSKFETFLGVPPKNLGQYSSFLGGLLFTHGSA